MKLQKKGAEPSGKPLQRSSRVYRVKPNKDNTVYVCLDDGKVRLYDANTLISKDGILV